MSTAEILHLRIFGYEMSPMADSFQKARKISVIIIKCFKQGEFLFNVTKCYNYYTKMLQ